MNSNSNYYLAINTGFPNAYDKANGRNGALLMIHGDCSSRGCYAMTDEQIGEITRWRARLSWRRTVVSDPGLPLPHDAENLARHRTNPNMAFWKMLKVGNDHFEVRNLNRRSKSATATTCSTRRSRPILPSRWHSIRRGVVRPMLSPQRSPRPRWKSRITTKRGRYAALVKSNTWVAPIRTGLDGGMNRVFLGQVGGSLPPATGAQFAPAAACAARLCSRQ